MTRLKSLIRFFLVASMLLATNGWSATRSVPEDFTTIQAAINAANSGDVVEVDIGTYRENLILRDDVDVQGAEAARTFLIAADSSLPVVDADTVNDVVFSNFSIIDSVSGVRVQGGSGLTFASLVFDGLSGIAIFIGIAVDIDIINNVFWNNATAIDRLTQNVDVTNNIFAENDRTVVSSGIDPINPDTNLSFNCFNQNDDIGNSGLGEDFQTGNPVFVDTPNGDFHLQEASVCIDVGSGTDIIDDSIADMGAYGGEFADAWPFPVAELVATDASDADTYNIALDWDANLAYLITSDLVSGSYRVYYQLNESGPPYDGTDAGDGTQPSPISVSDATSYTLVDLQPDSEAPGVPVLLSASPQNESVVLGWSAATGATGYTVYYGQSTVTDNQVDVGNATSYTVTGLENGEEYSFAVSARTQPVYYLALTAVDSTANQNESDYSAEVSIALGDVIDGELSNTLTAIPDEVVPYPDLPDKGGCFVATAAFGADWVAEVQVLRQFRDRYLITNTAGRAFVGWYYRHGPIAAAYLERNAEYKALVRALLWPLVALAAFLLGASLAIKVLTFAVLTGLLVFIVRVTRAARPLANAARSVA